MLEIQTRHGTNESRWEWAGVELLCKKLRQMERFEYEQKPAAVDSAMNESPDPLHVV